MADRKAVIKNADMAEDMQYIPHFNTIFYVLFVLEGVLVCVNIVILGRMLSTAPPRPSRSTTSRRTSPPSSRRSSIKSTTPPGTPSLGNLHFTL